MKLNKERIDQVDERTVALFQRYPLVGIAVFLVGALVGFLIAWVF